MEMLMLLLFVMSAERTMDETSVLVFEYPREELLRRALVEMGTKLPTALRTADGIAEVNAYLNAAVSTSVNALPDKSKGASKKKATSQ